MTGLEEMFRFSDAAVAQGAENDDAAYAERYDGAEGGDQHHCWGEMKKVSQHRSQGKGHTQ